MKAILFFRDLANEIREDETVLKELQTAGKLEDVYNILQAHGYVDFPLEDYLLLVLQAKGDIKNYLDPDTGEFSDDVLKS